ncbi:hypothetical protein AM1BK_02490 [Neobacillus kokaensis]|uniref:Uncharacterized protein n=2 Tax=Neobacillus kokaensis TaxID=2759023 RepID=A0ABQ3MXQ7_9BACI|nr:hypothetical protein AM1BK_02490 [Neobacillus kokaensis]
MATLGFFGFFKPFVQKMAKVKEWFHKSKANQITEKRMMDINWVLGIESPYYHSTKFTIEQQSVTINGYQTTYNHSWPVKYSIVKINKLGTSITYFDSVVFYGDYSEKEFKHTFHIPSGSDYQLEVFNYYKYQSTGKVKVVRQDT